MTWPEAILHSVGFVSVCAFLIVFFGTLATGRWPWDRR